MDPKPRRSARIEAYEALKAKPTKVTKSTKVTKLIKRTYARDSSSLRETESARSVAKVQTYQPTWLENGLLSLEKMPDFAVEIGKRNRSASPLLRLPGEIRNTIWTYASSGTVILHERYERNHFDVLSTSYYHIRNLLTTPAFHLPQVCRQIYAETVTLAYSLSTFSFSGVWSPPTTDGVRRWKWRQTPANGNAITSIRLSNDRSKFYFFAQHWKSDHAPRFRETFKELKYIYVSQTCLKDYTPFGLGKRISSEERAAREKLLLGIIKQREGESVEVVLEG